MFMPERLALGKRGLNQAPIAVCWRENSRGTRPLRRVLEGDVAVKAKLFSNRYWVSPFLQIGAGISKFRHYWGAFMPMGAGFQVNLFDEAFFMFNAQYRVAVTNTVSDHFFYSIGIAGNIGKRRASNNSTLPE
jgi:hypothetical protein